MESCTGVPATTEPKLDKLDGLIQKAIAEFSFVDRLTLHIGLFGTMYMGFGRKVK